MSIFISGFQDIGYIGKKSSGRKIFLNFLYKEKLLVIAYFILRSWSMRGFKLITFVMITGY